ncbi:reverse transcriptase-like protein [Metabacillus malikii]|uniref:Ribonuclease HI n=1 Tax=Metabacillus malikii TaxID=1504265 RepID=A0ABT9ZAG7_9BACI|nr:reverse transcriptase-like protein [Metabacillus malikii]MDQ0228831.1 ribonuclease HI [Metabacillus malikii]
MIEVYIDGASAGDPGKSGAGVFIKGNGQNEQLSFPLGVMTNHEAEFHALIKALEVCLHKDFKIISIRTDSQLVEHAVDKQFVKNTLYAPMLKKVLELVELFDLFFIKWIPSSENKVADKLARSAILKQ